jgi:hypothetical protein
MFFDVLLRKFSSHDVGCHLGLLFWSTCLYADDLVLIAPSVNATRHKLQVCEDYAAQYNVLFSATKSKCLCCHPVGTPKHAPSSIPHLPFYIDLSLSSLLINGHT